jgi:hypothetical protein
MEAQFTGTMGPDRRSLSLMDALRHKFLASSTLAGNQDRAVKSRNFQGYEKTA